MLAAWVGASSVRTFEPGLSGTGCGRDEPVPRVILNAASRCMATSGRIPGCARDVAGHERSSGRTHDDIHPYRPRCHGARARRDDEDAGGRESRRRQGRIGLSSRWRVAGVRWCARKDRSGRGVTAAFLQVTPGQPTRRTPILPPDLCACRCGLQRGRQGLRRGRCGLCSIRRDPDQVRRELRHPPTG